MIHLMSVDTSLTLDTQTLSLGIRLPFFVRAISFDDEIAVVLGIAKAVTVLADYRPIACQPIDQQISRIARLKVIGNNKDDM